MSPPANPIDTWLAHVQDSITHGDDDIAQATGLQKERLPLQAQDDGDGESRLRRAHKRDPDLIALIPEQLSEGHDHDLLGELQRRQQTLLPLGNHQGQNERAGDGLNLATSVPSGGSGQALPCFEEEFVRKPRRKTRPDRYETKKAFASDNCQRQRQNGDADQLRGDRKARLRIRLRSGKEVMSNFTSENICRDALITKPCVTEKHPYADSHTREGGERAAVADLICYDFDLGHDARRLPSPGHMHPQIRNPSCRGPPLLKQTSKYPSLETAVHESLLRQNAAGWPKALHGASSSHGRISTTLQLATKVSKSPRCQRQSKSKGYVAERPLHQPIHDPIHDPIQDTFLFDTKAQHRQGGYPGLDTFRPCRHDLATFQTPHAAPMDSSRACIVLGEGHVLDLRRLRNRGLCRADRVPIPGDEATMLMNKRASRLQHTRDVTFPRLEHEFICSRE
ncbi:hypothetical protein E4U42_003878 [Claviceps africana]|uniref:Uncharacterized protein n=1 Tax=Claviceps africana TaxID=83212 RepID=A0A8K0NHF5_9HYPO|nr:hypothetical protein E4U42_003878 [Claviceps africana]